MEQPHSKTSDEINIELYQMIRDLTNPDPVESELIINVLEDENYDRENEEFN